MADYKPLDNFKVFGHTSKFLEEVKDKVAVPMRDYLIEVRDALLKEKERLAKEKHDQSQKSEP